MAQRNTGRKRALIGLTALALLALTALAPAASAQIPLVPDSPVQLPGGGGGDGGGSDSGGSSGGGGLVDTVGGVVDTTTDTVGQVGSGTTDAVGNVGGGVTEGVGGAGEKIVDGTKKTVDNVTRDTGQVVNDTVGSVDDLGGGVTNPLLNVKSPLDRDRDGKVSPKERKGAGGGNASGREAGLNAQLAAERREARLFDAKLASLANAEKKTRDSAASAQAAIAPPQRETFITQLADAAKEAAEKLAFPLGLALMVGAFLMVQGRIDRKDAKLALAPIDSEQDLLSFQ